MEVGGRTKSGNAPEIQGPVTDGAFSLHAIKDVGAQTAPPNMALKWPVRSGWAIRALQHP